MPKVMGIINVTPDSFYEGSRTPDPEAIRCRVLKMIEEGVDIIDIGGLSTRPGSEEISVDEEYSRLAHALEIIRKDDVDVPISIDTYRAGVAHRCVEQWGVEIINDIGGGTLDADMWQTIADLDVAYILMHTKGTPATMQRLAEYEDVVSQVLSDIAFKVAALRQLKVSNVIVDPGFGFAKTTEQNYELLKSLDCFHLAGAPVLAGISRKSMIWKPLGVSPADALNGTSVLNTLALLNGADILRVHDVKEAKEAVKLIAQYKSAQKNQNVIITDYLNED